MMSAFAAARYDHCHARIEHSASSNLTSSLVATKLFSQKGFHA
ncbi:hypothetical protein [Bradyrhizobium sp. WSM3983]|nr:hypothetical protein [Bradyrhizobium sp. WSM3983]